jgi:hypothetical protein
MWGRGVLAAPALALLSLALGGCLGSDSGDADRAQASVAPSSDRGFLASADLERQLGNSFRRGLYRLAVMSQHSDDSADLGQDLPTGLLDRVRCQPSSPRPERGDWTWRCEVDWETAAGGGRSTRYAVRQLRSGCFSAGVNPPLPVRYDSTIRTYSEHPLNVIVSARRGC